jgi:hypothetical protein
MFVVSTGPTAIIRTTASLPFAIGIALFTAEHAELAETTKAVPHDI